jgi:hypothetical protein
MILLFSFLDLELLVRCRSSSGQMKVGYGQSDDDLKSLQSKHKPRQLQLHHSTEKNKPGQPKASASAANTLLAPNLKTSYRFISFTWARSKAFNEGASQPEKNHRSPASEEDREYRLSMARQQFWSFYSKDGFRYALDSASKV